jgi:uncharacterized protein YndB with AHSA1/START domain
MTRTITHKPDPKLDLVLQRVVDVAPNLVWVAWTRPEYVKQWFTPAPWQTVDCEIDLRPGGIFRTVMRSPEGQEFPNTGCYLEVIENEKLVWTAALKPGYRPQTQTGELLFTAVILIEPHGAGTKYTAIAIHGDEEGATRHAAMGFHDGWGKALDQLIALAKKM